MQISAFEYFRYVFFLWALYRKQITLTVSLCFRNNYFSNVHLQSNKAHRSGIAQLSIMPPTTHAEVCVRERLMHLFVHIIDIPTNVMKTTTCSSAQAANDI